VAKPIIEDRAGAYCCEAPAGEVWVATGTHELVHGYRDVSLAGSRELPERGARTEAKAALLEEVALGTEPCPARPSCDWCDAEAEEVARG
jgi:hypothetical protein